MKSIRLLHITDLHFGNKTTNYGTSVDVKDKSFPPKLLSKLNSDWTYDFYNSLLNWQRIYHNKFDAIVCTGDLGEKGIPKNIESGVKFLDKLCTTLELNIDNLILCPGNHDLQRTKNNTEFENYEKILLKYGIKNYCCYDKIFKKELKKIPIISINSCLGGTAKSEYSKRYRKIISKILPKDKNAIIQEFEKIGQQYLNDFLDVPAIGKNQLEEIIECIATATSDSAIILMHHNPVPNNNIEIRPYSNLVDSGKLLTSLLNTNKKSFILHGHTHYIYDILSYFPSGSNNYISSIGCGALNGSPGTKANIYEFYYTNNNEHIITKVHRVERSGGAGFSTRRSHNVFEKGYEKNEHKIYKEIYKVNKKIVFKELLEKLAGIEEDSVLKVILKLESLYLEIEKSGTDSFNDWIINIKTN